MFFFTIIFILIFYKNDYKIENTIVAGEKWRFS